MYTKEQQAENRQKWVVALRSDKYQQGKTVLHLETPNGEVKYCCLGVACEVSGLSQWGDFQLDPYKNKLYEYLGAHTELPAEVQDWLGLKCDAGIVKTSIMCGGKPRGELTSLNDNGYTFEQIADVIESNNLMYVDEY